MPEKPSENLREVDRALIHAVMFELGIVPIERANVDMRRVLQQLPPEEARKLARKFRKLWRKAMKAEIGTDDKRQIKSTLAKHRYGVGKHVSSRTEMRNRKQLVFDQLWKDVICPMVSRFENPTKDDLFTAEKKT